MTDEQRVDAILELARGLDRKKARFLEDYLSDLMEERCETEGHEFIPDHCGRPEHNFCMYCYTPQYSKEEREEIINARQAKANEAVGCNPTQPSESLGSGSILKRLSAWAFGK
jgi:hypothetical protein